MYMIPKATIQYLLHVYDQYNLVYLGVLHSDRKYFMKINIPPAGLPARQALLS